MKFALLTVSYSGLFYDGPALPLVEQIRKARALGFESLSIESKRPVASPLDLSPRDRKEVRAVAAGEGITLCAIESLSNFASPVMEERENNLAMMRLVLELASDLEIDLVKVFAAWPGLVADEDDTATYVPYERAAYYTRLYPADLRRWQRAVAGLQETADRAVGRGITLALQNHAPVLRAGYEDTLAMMRQVDRPNVKLCLDVPLFKERQSDAFVREAVQACGPHIVLTHYGAWNFKEDERGEVVQQHGPSYDGTINYACFISELQRVGYDGFLVSEYCLPCVENYRLAGIDAIDRANRMALGFMKQLVATTESRHAQASRSGVG